MLVVWEFGCELVRELVRDLCANLCANCARLVLELVRDGNWQIRNAQYRNEPGVPSEGLTLVIGCFRIRVRLAEWHGIGPRGATELS